MSSEATEVTEAFGTIQQLVERWCDRCALKPLRQLLPAYPLHTPHTDGWFDVYRGLKDVRVSCKAELPREEQEMLRTAMRDIAEVVDRRMGPYTVAQEADPYRALVDARPADIRLLIIGGSAVYGDEDLMRSLTPNGKLESLSLCGTEKMLDFETEDQGSRKPPKSWKDTVNALTKALEPWRLKLSSPAPCPP